MGIFNDGVLAAFYEVCGKKREREAEEIHGGGMKI